VVINTTLTLKAVGSKSGDTDSTVQTGLYTISPPSTGPVTITITCQTVKGITVN
jgi:hypothetical protein